MPKGVDLASTVSPTLAAYLSANGYSFVIRYLDDSFGRSAKTTKLEEIAVIHAAGLGYIPVFETTGATGVNNTPQGKDYLTLNQGMYDAQHAAADLETLGYPVGFPCCFAVDTDLTGQDLTSLYEYTKGLKDVLVDRHPIWIYGPWDVLAYCRDNCKEAVKGFWQAYAPAWSQGRNSQRMIDADIIQVQNGQTFAGVRVDVDESTWNGWQKMLDDEAKQWITDNVLKPLQDQNNSGFNTTLPTMLRRSAAGLDPFTGLPPETPPALPAGATFLAKTPMDEYKYADGSAHFWIKKPDGTWVEAGSSATP